jgi:hypothetical protein
MATLRTDDGDLVVEPSALEKAEAVHGDVRVSLAAVRQVRAVTDPWPVLRGIRAPGTGLPGVIAVGTRRGDFGSDFAVVHGKGPAVVVDLGEAKYSRLVITVENAESVADEILRSLPGH